MPKDHLIINMNYSRYSVDQYTVHEQNYPPLFMLRREVGNSIDAIPYNIPQDLPKVIFGTMQY